MGVDAAALRRWLGAFADAVVEHQDELTRLDSAIGDADHGSNLARGMKAVVAALDQESPGTPDAVLKRTGMTLVSTVGGASGPLYGTFFLRMGTAAGGDELDAAGFGAALRAGVEGVVARGKAERGDKTMYDALAPAVEAYEAEVNGAAGDDLGAALRAAADAAAAGRDATVPLQARKGRASYLGERSIGHQDPGATSAALLLATAAETLG
jgi:phosphoenolpyruvate---glycerone phosphotransferase subunit DhaL